MIRVLDIIEDTMVDGPGFRTSIYCAGCRHACKGCHNPQSWDFKGGREMTTEELMRIIVADPYANVTFSGGDPMYQCDVTVSQNWPVPSMHRPTRISGAIRVSLTNSLSPVHNANCSTNSTCLWTALLLKACATPTCCFVVAATSDSLTCRSRYMPVKLSFGNRTLT